ncbi:MAG: hypothetical protein IT349_21145 [Candidatus Eisenbacteria bacterium]|nr:hypothetical protein [Candidatus Eisenbacteria bacterium]
MLPSGLDEAIADEEDLVRFLTSSRLFSGSVVRGAAFLPRVESAETSVFRQSPASLDELWDLGLECAAVGRGLYGAAVIRAGDLRATSLDAVASEPPHRHAHICGWDETSFDPEMRKARRKEQASRLAQRARLIRREDKST